MSESSFRRLLRTHLTEFRRPRLETDYCQHCYDLQRKVMVDVRRAVERWRTNHGNLMESYFHAWDAHWAATNLSLEEQAGLYLRDFEHYISRHDEGKPCARHVNTGFPCGLFALRKRGSGFEQKKRLDLHEQEAQAGHELVRSTSYCWAISIIARLKRCSTTREATSQHSATVVRLEGAGNPSSVLASDWRSVFCSGEARSEHFRGRARRAFCEVHGGASRSGSHAAYHPFNHTRPHGLAYQSADQGCAAEAPNISENGALLCCQRLRATLPQPGTLCVVTLQQSHSCPVEVHWGCDAKLTKALPFCLGSRHLVIRPLAECFVSNVPHASAGKTHEELHRQAFRVDQASSSAVQRTPPRSLGAC